MNINVDRGLVRFAAAGLINTGVDWMAYYVLSRTAFGAGWEAKTIGIFCGILSAFVLNSVWVFRASFQQNYSALETPAQKRSFVFYTFGKMLAAYGFGMGVNLLVFMLAMRTGTPELIALGLATGCSLLVNFFISKKFVFRATTAPVK